MLNNTHPLTAPECIYQFHHKGEPVHQIILNNSCLRIHVSTLGAAINVIYMPDKNGHIRNIVAGYKDIRDYLDNPHYYGVVLGRCAGRISNGCFSIGGEEIQLSQNEGPHHLHGGNEGFGKKCWKIIRLIHDNDSTGVEMEYTSKDGEEGYPGTLQTSICFLLNTANELKLIYKASTDQPSPYNISHHPYFNLSGFHQETVEQHYLSINANLYTEKDQDQLATGNILALTGSPFQFDPARNIGEALFSHPQYLGFNQNYILDQTSKDKPAARLDHPDSGRSLSIFTDQPCVQLYLCDFWDGSIEGEQGLAYQQYGAVALETQQFPDAMNHPEFPSTYLYPGVNYQTITTYQFGLL